MDVFMKAILLVILMAISFPVFAGEPDKELHEKCIYPTVNVAAEAQHGTGVIVKSEAVDGHYVNFVMSRG